MELIKAKNKIEALKNAGFKNIYFSGKNPYSMVYSIYTYKVTVSKYNDSYIIISKKLN
jgi:hypothetical protein